MSSPRQLPLGLQFSQSSLWSLSRDNRRQIIQRLNFTPHLHCGHWPIFRRRHSIRRNQASVTVRLCTGLSCAEFASLARSRATSRATDSLYLFESRLLGLHGWRLCDNPHKEKWSILHENLE